MSDYLQAKAAANPQCPRRRLHGLRRRLVQRPDELSAGRRASQRQGTRHGVRMAPLLKAIFAPNDPRIASAADSYFVSPASPVRQNPMMSGTSDYWAVSTGGSGTSATGLQVAADAGRRQPDPWLRTTINFDWCG